MKTCWLASPKPDVLTCTDCGCEMCARASWTVRIESGCGKGLEVSHRDIRGDRTRRKEESRAWMLRCSDRQFSEETRSGWFGTRMGEWDFPPNIRVVGDSTTLAYLHP